MLNDSTWTVCSWIDVVWAVGVEVCCFIFLNNLSLASKVTKISRISVDMYVWDQFVDGKWQLTGY